MLMSKRNLLPFIRSFAYQWYAIFLAKKQFIIRQINPIALRQSFGHYEFNNAPDKKGKRDNLGIISHYTPLKCMLRPIIRTVLPRLF